MMKINKGQFIFLILNAFIIGCQESDTPKIDPPAFSVDSNHILLNGNPLDIRGVVYVVGYPGYIPWEVESTHPLPDDLQVRINEDIDNIIALGANTIRLWGAPQYCYEVIQETESLNIIQTIWFDGEVEDFQNETFKESSKQYIREVIQRMFMGTAGATPPLLAFVVGNELSEPSILSTNLLNPSINSYVGEFIVTDTTLSATEAFLAEMADYTKSYYSEFFDVVPLTTYANDIRTAEMIDTPFLDFRSHNAYSYAVDYYLENPPVGHSSGTIFQGWLEYLKHMVPDKPLLITETGLSVSPGLPSTGPPNYGYGGNTEAEQAQGLIQNLNDAESSTTPLAGVIIHEYLDAWWKFGLEDSYTHDPDDIEEWFGIMKLSQDGDNIIVTSRMAYNQIKTRWTGGE